MPTGREREWLGEWREERETRQEEQQQQRAQRYQSEPALRLLDGLRPLRSQVFLLLKCYYCYFDEDYHLDEGGLPVRAFLSLSRASEYRNALPGHGDGKRRNPATPATAASSTATGSLRSPSERGRLNSRASPTVKPVEPTLF